MLKLKNISSYFVKYLKNKSGNIALLTALLLPILIGLIGGMIDLSSVIYQKNQIQNAADTAILAALKRFSDENVDEDDKLEEALEVAEALMNVNLYSKGMTLDSFTLNITENIADDDAGSNIAVVDWQVNAPLYFLRIFGIEEYTLNGRVEAVLGLSSSKYVDLLFMIDFSSSMGIPATLAGIAQLKAGMGCEFACHSSSEEYIYAQANGIQLRMDVVKNAIREIATKINGIESNDDDQYRIGLYGFTDSAWTILEPTSNMGNVISRINNTAVVSSHTNLAAGMDHLRNAVGTQGEGSSEDDRIKLAVFLSDGLHDMPPWVYRTKTIGDVDCNTNLKNQDVKLMTVYTTYERFDSWTFDLLVQPVYDNIESDFESCASSGNFYQTRNVADINNAFDEIFVEFTNAGAMALTK